LLDEIGELHPGSRIAGVTSLAKRFGVARATAERVLNELARQGYVRQVPGSGTYVADRRTRRVAVLTYQAADSPSFYGPVIDALTTELRQQGHDVRVLCRVIDGSEPHGPSLDRVRQLDAQAYATVGIMNTPYLEELARLGTAIVAADYRPMSLRIDSVAIASMRSGYLATRALLLAGRSRVCYLGVRRARGVEAEEEEPDATAQRIGFERAHAEVGMTVPDGRIRTVGFKQQVDASWFMSDESGAPDGIVCFDDKIADELCEQLRARGRAVPGDVAIVACGGNQKKVSVFRVDPAEMGRIAARMLSERLSWPDLPVRDYLIWPDYYDGGTVPAAASEYILSLLQPCAPALEISEAQVR
jgi:DNA-binding LacI/PurR family transcriptional regulator